MSPRLSKIVTRTGDDGTTGLADGTRVPKDSTRIEAMGAVDELNSALGVLLAQPLPQPQPQGSAPLVATRAWLLEVQQRLFDLGGELAVPGLSMIGDEAVSRLEDWIEQLNAQLPPLKEFVLPGGGPAASCCHLARTICRRAERRCWALVHAAAPPQAAPQPKAAARRSRAAKATASAAAAGAATVSAASLRYLNRLSDFLFVLARLYARAAGSSEPLWQHQQHERDGGQSN